MVKSLLTKGQCGTFFALFTNKKKQTVWLI